MVFVGLVTLVWLWILVKLLIQSRDGKPLSRLEYKNFASSKGEWAIFYHIYVPAKSHKNALRIVKEQMMQINQRINQISQNDPVSLYLTTVGDWLPELSVENLPGCRSNSRLDCRHAQHLTEGSEAATLQILYDFCLQAQSDQVVTYLHSKGSYHRHKTNERWRNFLTNAALHHDCISKTTDQQCHVCGLHFYMQWTNFFPGNMYTARCEYVKKLLPPEEFTARQEHAVADLLWLRYRGLLATQLFTDNRPDRFGLERYSIEHWIGSHPHLKPCDMAPSPLRDWLKSDSTANEEHFEWKLGPRRHDPPADFPPSTITTMLDINDTARRLELFYLPGKLRLWDSLYQTVPRLDSWIWSWFPDGVYWREQLKDGKLPEFNNKYLYSEPPGDLALSSMINIGLEMANLSVFLLIDASRPVSVKTGLYFNQLLLFLERNDDIQLIYQITGYYWNDYSEIFDHSTSSRLKALTPQKIRRESETLTHLYQYCQRPALPSNATVLYLPGGDIENVAALFQKYTDSIQGGSYNVCGWRLFTGTNMHFENNTWVTKCSYIQTLLPPDEYVVAMNNAVARAWVETMKHRFVSVPDSAQCLGIDSDAMQSWVTSRPDFTPCDPPHSPLTEPGCDEAGIVSYNEMDDSMRLRSYSLLAGHLWRWNSIYGFAFTPARADDDNDLSWIWTTFPDGETWKEATKTYGIEDVVERITQPFADTTV